MTVKSKKRKIEIWKKPRSLQFSNACENEKVSHKNILCVIDEFLWLHAQTMVSYLVCGVCFEITGLSSYLYHGKVPLLGILRYRLIDAPFGRNPEVGAH
jgi:hypothetical protein